MTYLLSIFSVNLAICQRHIFRHSNKSYFSCLKPNRYYSSLYKNKRGGKGDIIYIEKKTSPNQHVDALIILWEKTSPSQNVDAQIILWEKTSPSQHIDALIILLDKTSPNQHVVTNNQLHCFRLSLTKSVSLQFLSFLDNLFRPIKKQNKRLAKFLKEKVFNKLSPH